MTNEASGRAAAFIGEAARIRIYLAMAELVSLGHKPEEAAAVLAESYRSLDGSRQRLVASLGEALAKLSDESLLVEAVTAVFGRTTTPEELAVLAVNKSRSAEAFRAAARMLLLNDPKTVFSA